MSQPKKTSSPLPLVLFVLIAFGLSLGAWVVFYLVAEKTPVEHIERESSGIPNHP